MGKILIIRGGALGDFILTLPTVAAIRQALPSETIIEILGYEPVTSLAKACGLADNARSIEYGPLAGFFHPEAQLDPELGDFFAAFSVIISYLHDPSRVFQTNVSQCSKALFLQGPHRPVETPPLVPAAKQLAEPLEKIGVYLESNWVNLRPKNLPESVNSGISNLVTNAPRVALHPGSGSPRKNWSWESWLELLKGIQRVHPKMELLVTSGEAEMERIEQFYDLLSHSSIPFQPLANQSLAVAAKNIGACDLYLGNDSGISHLAAATGVPAIVLFGPSEPKVWAPQNPRTIILQSPDNSMAGIGSAEVLQKALVLLPK
ncbi:MAG: glycosyltransferase family 9 protein [Verrucomicrobiales bacterium]